MKKYTNKIQRILVLALVCALLDCIALSGRAEASLGLLKEMQEETGLYLNSDSRLYDFYGEFDFDEVSELENWIEAKEQEGDISIRVFVAEMEKRYEKAFVEDCADALCDGGYAEEDLVLLLLNLDAYDRGACIQGYGLCEDRVDDDRIEYMLDDIIECFADGDYFGGVKLFATEAAYYAGSTDYNTYYKDNSFRGKLSRMPWAAVGLTPAGIAALGVFLMMRTNDNRKKMAGKTYLYNDNSGITATKDDYVRTSVSKTYSPRSSSSGGTRSGGRSSGGGGRSRGGRSHSGGSRRF